MSWIRSTSLRSCEVFAPATIDHVSPVKGRKPGRSQRRGTPPTVGPRTAQMADALSVIAVMGQPRRPSTARVREDLAQVRGIDHKIERISAAITAGEEQISSGQAPKVWPRSWRPPGTTASR